MSEGAVLSKYIHEEPDPVDSDCQQEKDEDFSLPLKASPDAPPEPPIRGAGISFYRLVIAWKPSGALPGRDLRVAGSSGRHAVGSKRMWRVRATGRLPRLECNSAIFRN